MNNASTDTQSAITDVIAEQLLHDLVATVSFSHHESAAVALLVNWMQTQGYDQAYIDEAGNAIGIIGEGENDIVLLGHIDTFPGSPPVRRDGRLLYGRGSVDAKGPLCTFAVAALRANLPTNTRMVVIGAVEEEAATSKGARYAATQFQPKACFIGEPSNWDRITLGYKGRLLLEWEWSGAMAHSAGPTLSPAEQAIVYWNTVLMYTTEYNTDRTSLFAQLDPSLRDINTRVDGAYGHAHMTIGFRLPPGITPDEIINALPPTDGATIRAYGQEIAFAAERDTTISRTLRGAIRANEGQPRFLYKTGTADMNVVGPIWNCPIVAYGPGDSNLDHTPDEHIDLDEYLRAISVLSLALERINF